MRVKQCIVLMFLLLKAVLCQGQTVFDKSELCGKWKLTKVLKSSAPIKLSEDSVIRKTFDYYFKKTLFFLDLKPNGSVWTTLQESGLHDMHWELNSDSSITIFDDSAKSFPMNRLQYVRIDYVKFKISKKQGFYFTSIPYDSWLLDIQIEKVNPDDNIFNQNNEFKLTNALYDCSKQLRGRCMEYTEYMSITCSGFRFKTSDSIFVFTENNKSSNNSQIHEFCDSIKVKVNWFLINYGDFSMVNVFQIENDSNYYQVIKLKYYQDLKPNFYTGPFEIFYWDYEGKNVIKTMRYSDRLRE